MNEILLVSNPRRRKKRRKTTTKRRKTRTSNPKRRRKSRKTTSRRRRRNPQRMTARGVQNQVMDGLQGAFGALALDVTLGYLPIPANLKAGLVGTGVKALLAIGIGIVGSNLKVIKPATAKIWSNGALTVVLHDELKKQVANFMPNIPMGEYLPANDYADLGYYGSGYNPNGMYLPDLSQDDMGFDQTGMGEYLNDGSGENYF
jgi:hypothetical protein